MIHVTTLSTAINFNEKWTILHKKIFELLSYDNGLLYWIKKIFFNILFLCWKLNNNNVWLLFPLLTRDWSQLAIVHWFSLMRTNIVRWGMISSNCIFWSYLSCTHFLIYISLTCPFPIYHHSTPSSPIMCTHLSFPTGQSRCVHYITDHFLQARFFCFF